MMAECQTHEMVQDFDIKENSRQKIVFRKYPMLEWVVALAFLVAFTFCEYMICWVNVENNRFIFHHNLTLALL